MIALVILALYLFDSWLKYKEPVRYSSLDDYIIRETPNGKIVENGKMRMKFNIPNGWALEREEEGEGSRNNIILTSPDFIPISYRDPQSSEGCAIYIYTMKDFNEVSYTGYIEALIERQKNNPTDKESVIDVSGHSALKSIYGFPNELDKGPRYTMSIEVEVPVGNKLYNFQMSYLIAKNRDRCESEFNKFLETVSIK